MPTGLSLAMLLFAQAAAYGPAPEPAKPAPVSPATTAERDCAAQNEDPANRQIIICAPKPDGYRLPPDVLEARRMKKQGESVRPKNRQERFADNGCARTGPMGCGGPPAVNFIAMAAVAAEVADRLSKGEDAGKIFETTPASGEYALYREARKKREEKEADAAAAKVKAEAEAEAQAQAQAQAARKAAAAQ